MATFKSASDIIKDEHLIPKPTFEGIPIKIYEWSKIESVSRQINLLTKNVRLLQDKIENLEKSEMIFVAEKITDEMAESMIKNLIQELKKKGEKIIDDIEIIKKFNIPIEQVDKILDKLIKDGIIADRK